MDQGCFYGLFLQVQQLTTDIPMILDCLRASTVVEVKVIYQTVSILLLNF